jgi:hypothetical protein
MKIAPNSLPIVVYTFDEEYLYLSRRTGGLSIILVLSKSQIIGAFAAFPEN